MKISRYFIKTLGKPPVGEDLLRRAFHYDAVSGIIVGLLGEQRGLRVDVGKQGNYRHVPFCGRRYRAHRLAWFLSNGTWPRIIDHKDQNKSNNALTNLRIANNQQSSANRRCRIDSHTGLKGVRYNRNTKQYYAAITVNGRLIQLGKSKNRKRAAALYFDAALKYFGEFASA